MKKKISYILIAALLMGAALYALRGPNISNALKKLILPELELITGKKFIAQKIYINMFPLFAEMKGVKAFDNEGNKILEVDRVKGYIGLSGLLRKEIIVKRLVIKDMEAQSDREIIEQIAASVKKYLSEEKKTPLKVLIKSVTLVDANVYLVDKNMGVTLKGFNADVVASDKPRFRISSKGVRVIKEGVPDAESMVEALFILDDDRIDIKNLKVSTQKSGLKTAGTFWIKKLAGAFETEAEIFVDTVKNIFGLKNKGSGQISAKGSIRADDLRKGISGIFVDLKLKGEMYLETLMELLEVDEKLTGHIGFSGELKGALNDIKGSAETELKSGTLFGVEIGKLKCLVSYSSGKMRFTDAKASLYNGTATAEAMITLPDVNYYSVKVNAANVDSKGLFGLIGWDPGIPEGKTSGEMETAGSSFNPRGKFYYRSASRGNDILGKVKEIQGGFSMKDNIIDFTNMSISTGKSSILASGEVDINGNTLTFKGTGSSTDINEFASPYFTSLGGIASYSISVKGLIEDPLVELKFSSKKTMLSTAGIGSPGILRNKIISFNSVESELTYRKNLLFIKKLHADAGGQEFRVSGNVHFPNARTLFELKSPDYDLKLSTKNISIAELSGTFHDGPPAAGTLNANLKLYGKPDDIRAEGEFHAGEFSWNGKYPVAAEGAVAYKKRTFTFNSVNIKRGGSVLNADWNITLDKKFTFNAHSGKVNISDLVTGAQRKTLEKHYKELFVENFFDTVSLGNLRIKGEGTLAVPLIELAADINTGEYRGRHFGKGEVYGILKGKQIDFTSRLFDRKMHVKGRAVMDEKFPWSVNIELNPARYDFIIANFMKDVPEDLLLNLRGSVTAHGDKDSVNASAVIKKAHLYLFGTGFTNTSDITAKIEDKKISIESLSMRSDVSEFNLKGNIFIGKGYDMLFEGASSLSPLKALSKNIDTIKGNASFVFSIAGSWDKPKINGDMEVTNGALAFKNIHHRLSSVSAYIYVDEDRIVLEKASGKLSGGDISMSGNAYLQGFSIKRFSLESKLKGITASLSKDFWINFDGNLYYRGNMSSQTLLGDIMVKRAKYSERLEWKSWLLKVRHREKTRAEPDKIDMTKLNVRMVCPNLLIDNNVARTSMKMDVLLRGTVGQPVIIGKIEAREGIVYFRNNEFKILKAAVDFSNPNQIRPYFDILAETRVRSYNIRLNLDGYVEQFNLSLASDPPLNETDIFSLLAVGQVGKSLKGLEGGIGASEATSFLTGKLQDVLEERVKTITGFDRVQIDPYISKSTGTVSTRLTIAKRLLADKLYVTYSTSVSTGEEQVWKLEYFLSRSTSLVGVRDERGGLGGDVKFRFEFR